MNGWCQIRILGIGAQSISSCLDGALQKFHVMIGPRAVSQTEQKTERDGNVDQSIIIHGVKLIDGLGPKKVECNPGAFQAGLE